MAKDKLTEYDATAANNTVVGDVNLAENSALPSDMNNAVRELMSHQKEAFGSGTPLYVDQTNNRVGVGNSAPSTALEVDADGATVLTVDRATSHGDIVEVQKDGTRFGALGSQSSGFYIDGESGHEGIRFANGAITPRENGSDSDNASDLGASNNRFKDLYLGGNLYIGGTGSANGLSDYEEGTVTSISDGSGGGLTYSLYHGRYRKIGDIVNYELDFQFPITSDTSQNTVTCLPFNPAVHGSGTIGYTTYNAGISVLALDTSNNIKFYNLAGSGLANNSLSNVRFLINFTYQTNA